MPLQNFTTGRDITISIITQDFGVISLDLITGFSSKQMSSTESPKGIDGRIRHLRYFQGWQGSFSIERRTPELDQYFALQEANYWDGISELPASLTTSILETDGTSSQWRYTELLLSYDDAGEYRGDSTVKQSLSFLSAKRILISQA